MPSQHSVCTVHSRTRMAQLVNESLKGSKVDPASPFDHGGLRFATLRDVVIMCHLHPSPLETAFDVEAFIGLGAIQDALYIQPYPRSVTLHRHLLLNPCGTDRTIISAHTL